MPVHCSKCGEQLLGAVNRCWKCGQMFSLPPEMDGRPPVRALLPGSAIVTGQASATLGSGQPAVAPGRQHGNFGIQAGKLSTADVVAAHTAAMMAMGGTVASLVLGAFAALLSIYWPPAAIVAVVGLVMGIWGLSSPRRNVALVGMLICCLAIGIGAVGVARNISTYLKQNSPITIDETPTDEP
jgi:hypothetical protein